MLWASTVGRFGVREMGEGAVRTSIVGVQGDLVGMSFAISGAPVTFGREEDNDVVIHDPSVSRWHAELQQEADGYVLTDRHSSNGTWVNGAAITTTHRLRSGDEIMIAGPEVPLRGVGSRATIQRTRSAPPAEAFDPASVLRVTSAAAARSA
jgi:pSer/pThr/pTyr-binding forkhead associated (FHA) protein